MQVEIKVGCGRILKSTHEGTVKLSMKNNGRVIDFFISDVLFLSKLKGESLLSWNQLSLKCRMNGKD